MEEEDPPPPSLQPLGTEHVDLPWLYCTTVQFLALSLTNIYRLYVFVTVSGFIRADISICAI